MEVLFYGGLILLLWYPAALSVTVVFLRVLGTTFSISIAQVRNTSTLYYPRAWQRLGQNPFRDFTL